MKRILLMILGAIVVLTISACSGKVDDSTSEKYINKAEEVISLLNEGNYKEIRKMFDEEMESKLSEEQMEELTPIIEQSGTFDKIDKASIEEKDGFYVTVLVAKYSKEKRVFTISFNKKEEIAGLFIK